MVEGVSDIARPAVFSHMQQLLSDRECRLW